MGLINYQAFFALYTLSSALLSMNLNNIKKLQKILRNLRIEPADATGQEARVPFTVLCLLISTGPGWPHTPEMTSCSLRKQKYVATRPTFLKIAQARG